MSGTVFRMPSLGSDMEAGTLIEWTHRPGERLHKGDTIAVVETQKGAIEVEVFHDAVMGRPLIEPGETVPVGTAMAELEPLEAIAEQGPGAGRAEGPAPAAGSSGAAPGAYEGLGGTARGTGPAETSAQGRTPAAPGVRASPAARRLAAERGIALAELTGSGPDGAIVLGDLAAAAKPGARAPAATPAQARPAPRGGLDLAAMRQAIAAAMSRSKREIPHYYLSQDIDLTVATEWLGARNADLPPAKRLLMGVLFIKAVAITLPRFPELNGFDRDGRFEPSEAVHVGSATAIRGGGLIAPAIHDADRLDLATVMNRLRNLVSRVRSGGLRASELSDPTVTVSSLGDRGVDRLYGIIYPPQVAIVGFGTPRLGPWVVEGGIVPRTLVTATLAADHRHSDGHRGALFLAALAQRLQEPDML
jgi:pyruvate dehydrogenase E2 component (dihydrolipoamide acetyltransferase)